MCRLGCIWKQRLDVQNAESDADRGDHNKSEEGVVTLVVACLSTAKFLEAIKETLYHIPPFIHLFIKWPRLLCVHFRRDRIAGELVMQISSDFFCAIGFIGKNIAVLQIRKQLQQRNRLRAIINISGRQQKATGRRSFPTLAWIFAFRPPRVLPMLLDV